MLKRAIAILLLIVGIAQAEPNTPDSYGPSPRIGAVGHPQEPPTGTAQSVGHQQNRGTPEAPLIIDIAPTLERQADRAREAAQENEKSTLDRRLVDLTASLATYTAWLFAATLALVIVTGALVVVGFRQLQEARNTLVQLERPHLRVAVVQNDFKDFWDTLALANGDPIPASGSVGFVFRNYGKYPAFTKEFYFSVENSTRPPGGNGTLTPLRGDPIISTDGQTVKITGSIGKTFSPQEAKEIRSSQRKIWIFGSLIYGNVIGIGGDFTTAFLWVYDGPADTWSPSDEGGPSRNRHT